jgi:hypothetical protein
MDISNLGFIDASSWTDRFHRDLQKITMRNLFNPFLAEAWAQLVVHCDWYAPKTKRIIKYGQGQGMGTNGSFDIATLTDHLFLKFIRSRSPIMQSIHSDHIRLYGKVGDDLFTYDYKTVLGYYEQINLPINLSKSKIACELGSVAEFCSRTVINGLDVSRISPNIIQQSNDFRSLPVLISLCSNRNIVLRASSFPQLRKKTKSGESYLEKLQPYLFGLYALMSSEQSSFKKGLQLQTMVEEEWFVDDKFVNYLHDPQKLATLLISHCIVEMAVTASGLQDKVFELVDGMEFYGDEVNGHLDGTDNLFDIESEFVQYLLSEPFKDQEVVTPKQITVLKRLRDQRSLIHNDLEEVIERVPNDVRDVLEIVKDVSRICHKSCYDGGDLSYDTKKMQGIIFGIVKTLDRLDEDFKVLTLPESNLRTVYQYIQYDRIVEKFGEVLPELKSKEP